MRRTTLVTTLALALVGVAGSAGAQTVISADVTSNTTWSGTVVLQQPIFVKDGATLTILPGTIVRGQPRTAPVQTNVIAGSPGALVVTQTGRIVANASAANPIIMTTAAVDNNQDGNADFALNGFEKPWVPGDLFLDGTPTTAPLAPLQKNGTDTTGLWGGLVILGNAPTNNANKSGVGYGKTLVEGLTVPGFPAANATYGGILPHDNSGILNYVSIRHAGDEIGNSNELNGLTMGGVGDGTTIQNIEVYVNFDDGIEWFGGTVNGRNLAVFYVGDDSIDVDEGYTGLNQFVFTIQSFFKQTSGAEFGSASGDKIGEMDGDNYRPDNTALNDNLNTRVDVTESVFDPTPWPLSNTNFYNWTGMGIAPVASPDFPGAVAPTGIKLGIQFRNGFAGNVFNSIIVNTGAQPGITVNGSLTSGAPGFNAIENANNGLIALVCSTLAGGGALGAGENTVVANGNALNLELGGNAGGNNQINNPSFPGLANADTTFNPTGNAAGKLVASLKSSPINPRPASAGVGTVGCVAPRGPGLDIGATYRGAFQRTAATLWTTGWTTLSRAGLLAN